MEGAKSRIQGRLDSKARIRDEFQGWNAVRLRGPGVRGQRDLLNFLFKKKR